MRPLRLPFLAFMLVASMCIGCSTNLLNKAQQYELAGKNASALITYRQILGRTPASEARLRSDVLMRMGECLYKMNRYPEAFDSFEKAVDADSQNSLAHLRMGEMLLAAGSPDRAREQAMAVLGKSANNNEALSLLGASWAAADHPMMAKAVYEQVLRSDPKRVRVAVALADIYNAEDDTDQAREILKSAAKAQPQSSMPWLALARLEEQEGNGVQAEEAYRHAVMVEDTAETNMRLAQFLQRAARVAEAEQVLRRVDAEQRDYPVALADFRLLSGHAEDALQHYQSALEATPAGSGEKHFWNKTASNKADPRKQATVAARMVEAEIATAYRTRGKEKAAKMAAVRSKMEQFRQSLDPGTIAVLETEIALLENNVVLAQMFAQSAVEEAPDSSAAHYVNGEVESALGTDENAEREWQAAVDGDPHYTPARLAIAREALAKGDGATADENVRVVVRDDPGNFNALIIFSKALLMQGEPSLAAAMAARAAALDPTSVEPTLLAGEISLKFDHIAEALLFFERAIAEHPDSEDAIRGLLQVYQRGSVSYSAVEKMENAAAKPPVSATLLEIAGRLYAAHGWYTEAIRALTKAVDVDPSRTTAARALAHLQLTTGDVAKASKLAEKSGASQEPLLRAYQAEAEGKWEQAAVEYERAVREGDPTGVAANNLAWLYAEHSTQLERALTLAQSAVKNTPSDPAVLDTMGFVYLQRREYSDAVKVLETAARLSARSNTADGREIASVVRRHLSEAYFRAGQTSAATQIAQNRGPFALQ
jgi:tetratricopeptide (TPR) repeat protein